MKKNEQKKEIRRLSETARMLNEYTLGALLPLWADNLGQNMPYILAGKNVEDIPKRKGEPALVVAAGPSLVKKRHIQLIKSSGWVKKHPLITCDRLLISLTSANGVIPYCVCTVDAVPMVADFYRHSFIKSEYDKVHPAISVFAHPDTVAEIRIDKKEIYWFIPFMDDALNDPTSLTRMVHLMTKKSMIMVGGNVGTLSWNLAMYLGCNPIILVGFDLSYDDPNIANSLYYKALLQKLRSKKKVKKMYAMAKHPFFGTKYILDPVFKSYREMFRNYAATAERLYGVKTINATEGGAVFGEGIECTTLKEALRRYN